MNTQKKRK